jgi:uncharacterized OsmC-like protein
LRLYSTGGPTHEFLSGDHERRRPRCHRRVRPAPRGRPGRRPLDLERRTTWTGAFTSESHAREHGPIVSDEPELLAGGNTAANPVEYVLAALGSCLAVGYAAGAAVRGIDLRSLEIELSGTIDLRVFLGLAEGHAGYERIEATARIESDAGDAELQQLHEHVLRTSPVGNTIEHPVALDARLVRV